MTASLSIGILFEHRLVTQSQPADMIAALKAQGHRVILLDPQSFPYEAGNRSWLRNFDLTIARGQSLGLQYLLAWAKMQSELNISQCAPIQAKAELTAAQFRAPRTSPEPINSLSCRVHDSCYTVVFNPVPAVKNNGLLVVHSPDQLVDLHGPKETKVDQQYLPNDGCDLKLYGIGNRIWAVRGQPLFSPTPSSTFQFCFHAT